MGSAADCNWANGGLIPNAEGMMIGLPFDEEAFAARWSGEPKPKGPKPILEMPAKAGGPAPGDAPLAPGLQLIGKPGPHDRRYALGRDHIGPVLHGLPPLRPRGDGSPSKEPGSE